MRDTAPGTVHRRVARARCGRGRGSSRSAAGCSGRPRWSAGPEDQEARSEAGRLPVPGRTALFRTSPAPWWPWGMRDAKRGSRADGLRVRQRLEDVICTLRVSTGTRDIDATLIAARRQSPGARPQDHSLLSGSRPLPRDAPVIAPVPPHQTERTKT
ncbi:DUF5133 domain-containing protein [Streptomyces heliomycini]|uniref:DUF5133 domain-containing protein n=2 Tax=Streptomyces TaxID=1883 RepID=A0ABV5LHG0_9ACTN